MGSVTGGGSAQRNRYNEDTWNTENQNRSENTNSNRSGNRRAVYDSEPARNVLTYLTDQTQQGGGFQKQSGDAYSALAAMRGGVNPEVENIISSTNAEADRNFANRMAQSRAAGYRGNTAAGLYDQDRIAQQFTQQQAGDNSALRYGAYNDAMGRNLSANVAGAGGLAGLSGQSQITAAQLLSLLRGEDTADQTQSNTNANTLTRNQGGRSGKQSATKMFMEGTYGTE